MLLIPAIDLKDGRCVRLFQGSFDQETTYSVTPQALLRRYQSLGAHWLHIVDLDGARHGHRVNHALIAGLALMSPLRLQVGGGLRSIAAIEVLLNAGVARVVIGSAAIQRPDQVRGWFRRFGPERLCLAFDVRHSVNEEPIVQTHGWTRSGHLSLWDALHSYRTHVRHVLCTDIARDGTLGGPNLALYRSCLEQFPKLAWQASGGIRDGADLKSLATLGIAAAVSGKALLEERIPSKELQPFLPDASSPASTYATARL
jgi:phosphoribosylformimino-5-aminoimidazole carboxamide ribotide isomerase